MLATVCCTHHGSEPLLDYDHVLKQSECLIMIIKK